MAAPNIVNVATIKGKTVTIAAQKAATVAEGTQLIANPDDATTVFKVNSIIVANVDGTSPADITIKFWNHEDSTSGTKFSICSTVAVPADASLIVIDKNTSFYMEPDTSVYCTASEDSDLEVIASYEEIS